MVYVVWLKRQGERAFPRNVFAPSFEEARRLALELEPGARPAYRPERAESRKLSEHEEAR